MICWPIKDSGPALKEHMTANWGDGGALQNGTGWGDGWGSGGGNGCGNSGSQSLDTHHLGQRNGNGHGNGSLFGFPYGYGRPMPDFGGVL